ncbi:YoaK family protein [Variovorax sp. dw_954]|uniref:YoaK family protein n=1 Tax=Variovorax sp. dw_954 TaxID=2720078 RepID=UPI001BD654B6|nr:YoaK family protein [Variovorax sp. dw_954]
MTARWANLLYGLVGRRRTQAANRQLGCVLAAVAGAINAGGFLAVHRYTSHMTGIVSSVADDLAIGSVAMAFAGVAALATFMAGAACTALLINWARRHKLHSKYALALMVEAALLLLFGLAGANLASLPHLLVPSTVLLLCFIMGLQNAIITKISDAEIRTTHMTGIATDIGIELGRLVYWNRNETANTVHFVKANRDKLFIHSAILASFFVGGVGGAMAFKAAGFAATVPIACTLAVLALPPILVDLQGRRFGRRSAPGR